MKKDYESCVYIGRFQPFHNGHLQSIKKGLDIAEKIIICIGTSNRPRSIKNPWIAKERIDMVREAILTDLVGPYDPDKRGWSDKPSVNNLREFLDKRLIFVTNRDYMYDNRVWASEIFAKAVSAGATDDKSTCLIGCFKDDTSWYLKIFSYWDLKVVEIHQKLNSTDIRKDLFSNKDFPLKWKEKVPSHIWKYLLEFKENKYYNILKKEYDFIQDYRSKFEGLPYLPIFVTVDTIVLKCNHVLLIKRGGKLGKNQWALPGGYVNADEKIRTAAIRELKEETKIGVDKSILKDKIVDVEIFDHPQRSLRGRIITHAHLIDLGMTGSLPKIKAGSDAKEVHWIPLYDAIKLEDEMFEDHFDILNRMIKKY